MLNKISRYYHTLKHLKLIQLRYQVWYRLRAKFFPIKMKEIKQNVSFQKIKLSTFPKQHTHVLGEKTFQFLNLSHTFDEKIDWNYTGNGKLWAYHLNYFDFLNQTNITKEKGFELIEDFQSDIQNRTEGLDPYPTSLRLINWLKFLSVHNEYPQPIIDSIFNQYQILTKKLEYHLLANHLLENAFSILFGAVFFQDKKLISLCRMILKNELEEQILEDGGHYELSPMYHITLLQRALDAYNLLLYNKHDLHDVQNYLKNNIQKMVNWLYNIMFSNGEVPMLNDSVQGQSLEPREILKYAKELGFNYSKSVIKETGYRKYNFGDFEMVADVGEVGPNYQPGHAHSDTLSFVLYSKGLPIIVDRGTSTYENSLTRVEERSTSSHNTVIINSEEQTDIYGAFRVGRRAIPEILKDDINQLTASHDGYKYLGVNHKRDWEMNENILIISDVINVVPDNKGIKSVASFHFHPSVSIEQINETNFEVNDLIISFKFSGALEVQSYNYCRGFNKMIDSAKIVIEFKEELVTQIKPIV